MSAHDRSGYLDDGDPVTRATQLFRHVQAQPYHHRIRPGHSALEDVDDDDDVVDDSEARQAAANLAPGGNGQGYGSERSISSWDSEEEARKAQQEWEESIAQLNLALQVMVLPFFGKWLGRKWSYWAFTRYQQHGLTAALFGLHWIWAPTTIVPSAAVAAVQP